MNVIHTVTPSKTILTGGHHRKLVYVSCSQILFVPFLIRFPVKPKPLLSALPFQPACHLCLMTCGGLHLNVLDKLKHGECAFVI